MSTALVARGLVRSCRAPTTAVRLANPFLEGFPSCYLSETAWYRCDGISFFFLFMFFLGNIAYVVWGLDQCDLVRAWLHG